MLCINLSEYWTTLNNSLHLEWKYARISVHRHSLFWEGYSFPRRELKENCELQGTDNVEGQLSKHIFTPNGGYCVSYPSNLFRTHAVLKIGGYSQKFPSFSWGVFGHVKCLDQSHASKNIWWILNTYMPCLHTWKERNKWKKLHT